MQYFLTLMILCAFGCVLPTPYNPPEIRPTPEPVDRQCDLIEREVEQNVPGFPKSVHLTLNIPSEWCSYIRENDYPDFNGSAYLVDLRYEFDDWDLIDYAIVRLGGHEVGWVIDDEPGWDPNFDVMPYHHKEYPKAGREAEDPWYYICLPINIEASFTTPRKAMTFMTYPTYQLCED